MWHLALAWIAAASCAEGVFEHGYCSPAPGGCRGQERRLAEAATAGWPLVAWSEAHSVRRTPILAGDWDGDGRLDLLVATRSEVAYFRRLPDGTLAKAGSLIPGVYATGLATAHWGGEGGVKLLVGTCFHIRCFQNTSSGALEELTGDNNPFRDVSVYGPGTGRCMDLAPTVADWDGDGDLDLIVGAEDGALRFWERLDGGGLAPRRGGANPFRGIGGAGSAAPAVADWDSDGDLDLLVGNADGAIRYFERVADGGLVERPSPAFGVESVIARSPGEASPAAVDWDGDGELDLLVGMWSGEVRLLRGSVGRRFAERAGAASPFRFVDVGRWSAPAFVNWSASSRLDLLVASSETGRVSYYEYAPDGYYRERPEANPFKAHDIGSAAAPQAVDWIPGGRPEFIVGTAGGPGRVRYFQWNTSLGALEELQGDANPFDSISYQAEQFGFYPTAANWDGHGRIDVVATTERGSVLYFKGNGNGHFELRTGSDNPFLGAQLTPWITRAPPAVVDFDGDGDADLVLRTNDKRFRFFERVDNATLAERPDSGNPFRDVPVSTSASFALADWDADGDLDLLLGRQGGDLKYLESGWCELPQPCNLRGLCDELLGTCTCMRGYGLVDCSGCTGMFYTNGSRAAGSVPSCDPCPGLVSSGEACLGRGECEDDRRARERLRESNASSLAIALAKGNGTCACHHYFTGGSCKQGKCPPGFQYSLRTGECLPCHAGQYKAGYGNEALCQPCGVGTFSHRGKSSKCERCHSRWLRLRADSTRTSCVLDTSNMASGIVLVGATLVFLMVPCMLGAPGGVLDLRRQDGRVVLTSHGGHWLLRGLESRARFWGTGVPWLDKPPVHAAGASSSAARAAPSQAVALPAPASEGSSDEERASASEASDAADPPGMVQAPYRLKYLRHDQLLLCDAKGAPLAGAMDSSVGHFRLVWCHALLTTGVWRVPFLGWTALVLGGTASANALLGAVPPNLLDLAMLALGAALACAAHGIRWTSIKSTRLAEDLQNFGAKLARANPNPSACPRGPHRAITAEQLWELFDFFRGHIGSRTMYYVDPNIVRPLTRPFRLSYAELAGPSTVQWFVSHFWGTPFSHFVETVRTHAETVAGEEWLQAAYWVCTFSSSQWNVVAELGAEGGSGSSWERSSFYLALRSGHCSGTVMVFDSEAMPLTRSWCLFELLQTVYLTRDQAGFEGLCLCTHSGVMNRGQSGLDVTLAVAGRLAHLRLEEAQASEPRDKRMIDDLVRSSPGGFDAVNGFLSRAIWEVLQTAERRFQADLGRLATEMQQRDLEAQLSDAQPSPR